MQKEGSSGVLKEISRSFTRARRGRSRRLTPVPTSLRESALAALRGGHSAGEIADAAGISRQSIVNWARCAVRVAAPKRSVELKLVDKRAAGPAASVAEVGSSVAMVRIRLTSGAVMVLPVASLDARLLAALSGSAP